MSAPRRIAIVGGGVTGLACAHFLVESSRSRGVPLEVTVLEGSARLGGNIQTENRSGFILDGGPDSWVATKPDATRLARALRLGPELIPTTETHRGVYVALGRELHRMPEGLVLGIPTSIGPMVRTSLFGWDAKLRAALEPIVPPREFHGDADDESVGAFVARRLGDELAERLAAPLLGGIFAGDAYSISVRAAFPQLVAAEREHGSLIRAMRAQRRLREAAAEQEGSGARPSGHAAPSAFLSLRGGMGSLIEALAAALGSAVDVRSAARVTGIDALPAGDARGRYAVGVAGSGATFADDVVLTGPTRISGALVRGMDGRLGDALGGLLGYASTATVFLAFKRSQIHHPLDATGFIVPRSAGRSLLAATWVSSKWEHRAPAGHALVRAFFGGAGKEEVLEGNDAALVELALRELNVFHPIEGRPLFSRVYRFERVSPQPHLATWRAPRASG